MPSKLEEHEELLVGDFFSAKDTMLLDTCLVSLSKGREDSNIQKALKHGLNEAADVEVLGYAAVHSSRYKVKTHG